jgi:hypothetical protein
VVFASNWATAPLGTSDQAITDNGRWTRTFCGMFPDLLRVVDDVVPPNTNLTRSLRTVQRGADGCRAVQVDAFVPRATSWYLRFYFRNDDTQPNGDHVSKIETTAYRPLTFIRKYSSAEGYRLSMFLAGGGRSYPISEWFIYDRSTRQRVQLRLREWYRLEYFVEYIDPVNHPERFRLWPRVYDAQGTLLYDHNDFFMNDAFQATFDGRNDWSLASWYQAGRYMIFDNLDHARNFMVGNNGQTQPVATNLPWYFAGVEIRTDRWAGPAR